MARKAPIAPIARFAQQTPFTWLHQSTSGTRRQIARPAAGLVALLAGLAWHSRPDGRAMSCCSL